MTTTEKLSEWFDEGKAKGATHMIIVCDTYDWEDFPVFVYAPQNVRKRETTENSKEMQKIMEVYNLSLDKQMQLDQMRALNY